MHTNPNGHARDAAVVALLLSPKFTIHGSSAVCVGVLVPSTDVVGSGDAEVGHAKCDVRGASSAA
jgi:hypothetical protein